jgi:phosphatidylglycerophosphatase A
MKGGAGIMLDDLVAALYTALLLAFLGWLIN